MKLAVVGATFDMFPIHGIEELLSYIEEVFEVRDGTKAVFCTYSFSPELAIRISRIIEGVRVFAGRAKSGLYSGIYVTQAQTHFKGMIAWNPSLTMYYIGSSNLTLETGGNYGVILIKNEPFIAFDMDHFVSSYKSFQNPIDVIFSEIIRRETGGKCEVCGRSERFIFLNDDGRFVCGECRR